MGNSWEQLAEWYTNDLLKYLLWTPQDSTCLFTLLCCDRHASTHNTHTDVYTCVVIHSSTEELNKSIADKRS